MDDKLRSRIMKAAQKQRLPLLDDDTWKKLYLSFTSTPSLDYMPTDEEKRNMIDAYISNPIQNGRFAYGFSYYDHPLLHDLKDRYYNEYTNSIEPGIYGPVPSTIRAKILGVTPNEAIESYRKLIPAGSIMTGPSDDPMGPIYASPEEIQHHFRTNYERMKKEKQETSPKKASASFSPETRSRILKSANRERILRVCSGIKKGGSYWEDKDLLDPDRNKGMGNGPSKEPLEAGTAWGETGGGTAQVDSKGRLKSNVPLSMDDIREFFKKKDLDEEGIRQEKEAEEKANSKMITEHKPEKNIEVIKPHMRTFTGGETPIDAGNEADEANIEYSNMIEANKNKYKNDHNIDDSSSTDLTEVLEYMNTGDFEEYLKYFGYELNDEGSYENINGHVLSEPELLQYGISAYAAYTKG